ncbi:MAG: hypothetical protein A2845_05485 [Candidatus Lloydbacteria bacterium RIFCSPHIGHO2_01_FULL_49_22]|uniref:Uncharacterized protein n=1 Tax=Candidatus Lloydbacteria bacterium RIFCSPHIGHO2_01_FULL_49_22 TaxID=1798658 RepID=A0A1G2CTJ3_9BACT|nr:MAG: hypothetical protein A2845_05485 [Candidatus Lloydbacteria bacterium RIFCSPHIGHO2_01_FULL_49_22]OGZ09127.1 MAG: hypothetical protein A3C14_04030 [Candidatus Lloydbacteria bacterium RIFCSPHIGHO2_02_FULL_50_18]
MSILTFIEEAVRRMEQTGEEFCVSCGRGMGFSAMNTHVDHPVRYENGARYVEGSGQVCGDCAAKEDAKK